MQSLIVMGYDFTQYGEIPLYESLQLTRSYWGVGSCQLTLHPSARGADCLQADRLIFPASDPSNVYLIEDITETRSKMTVKGVQLKGLAKRRICVPPMSLPVRLWQYASGTWSEITDADTIRTAMQTDDVLQGFTRPESATEGVYFLDLTELGAVYDWGIGLGAGEIVSDLGTAQLRSKYQNFGWDRYTGDGESALLHYAAGNMIAPEDAKRTFASLIAATNEHRGTSLPWQARFDKLDALLSEIGEATGLGWDIVPDYANARYVFGARQGVDRSTGTQIVLISEDAGNAASVTRKRTTSGSSTTVYVGGAGEDENRMILSVGNEPEGSARRELWAEAGSVDDADMLRLYGQTKLVSATDSLTAEILDKGVCRWRTDYDLGDIVVLAGVGAQMSTRIIEATEIYERAHRSVNLTFGSAAVTTGGILAKLTRTAAR